MHTQRLSTRCLAAVRTDPAHQTAFPKLTCTPVVTLQRATAHIALGHCQYHASVTAGAAPPRRQLFCLLAVGWLRLCLCLAAPLAAAAAGRCRHLAAADLPHVGQRGFAHKQQPGGRGGGGGEVCTWMQRPVVATRGSRAEAW